MILSDLQRTILDKKGLSVAREVELEKYLNPNWERDLLDESQIKNISKAIERIKQVLDKNEKIFIYADYDCDGIPGAVILHDFFQSLHYENFEIYIPHRHREGFGLNVPAIEKISKAGAKLIITVDLGITNFNEVELANELGLEMIITDHHLPLEENGQQILPAAYTIINTKLSGDKYAEKFLCGTSTVWKLVNAFLNKYRVEYKIKEGQEKWWLDMVALASVADLIPLQNENRLLTKFGLRVLKKSPRPGLRQILRNAKVNQQDIEETDIAFALAPRINSASRMSDPIIAFRALLNNEEAINYANKLENLNKKRRVETKRANDSLNLESFKDKAIILTGDESWTPGILGLIASRIVEETHKTTFVWGLGEDENILKGSVRSDNGNESVLEIMSKVPKDILDSFGGHAGAGGFSLKKENLNSFTEFLNEYSKDRNLNQEETKIQTEETILVNEEEFLNLDLASISRPNLLRELEIFKPFGVGNEKPIFKIKLEDNIFPKYKRFGKSLEHLEVDFDGVRAIEFFVRPEREQELKSQKEFLVHVERDNFRRTVVLRLVK